MRAPLVWLFMTQAVLSARSVDACQPPPCIGGQLIPVGDFPVDLPGFLWFPEADTFDTLPAMALSARLFGGNGRAIPTHLEPWPPGGYLIVPDEQLSAGLAYRLELSRHCTRNGTTAPELVELHATASNGVPTRAGGLTPTPARIEPIHLADGSGVCSRQVRSVFVDVELQPDDPLWRNTFIHQTFVDGVEYHPSSYPGPIPFGSSWLGRGVDRIYTTCEDPGTGVFNAGVGEGAHIVTMQLGIPGLAQTWTTDPLQIVLDCDGVISDGGVPDLDGGSKADAGVGPDAMAPGIGALSSAEPSCGCRAAPARAAIDRGLLLLLLGLGSSGRWLSARAGLARVRRTP